jgi:hypothetical protein
MLIKNFILIIFVVVMLMPARLLACACGCNVFSVGGRWMMPISTGISLHFTYNYMNQYQNWNGWNSTGSDLNEDKTILSEFYSLNMQYMIDRSWGIMVDAPFWNRYFKTTDDDGSLTSVNHFSAADIRLMGIYTGISEDMSIGIQFGLKLPTGPYDQSLLDRDTQIGSGTTDLLLGGYHMEQENGWGWYAQMMWQHAFNYKDGYKPGDSFDLSFGAHYDRFINIYKMAPMLHLAASFRGADKGIDAEPDNTGYFRLYLSPGIEVKFNNQFQIYGNFKIPLTTHVNGYQLVAPALVDVTIGYLL